ncbi:MAG TPA: LacI family DNA-binding transcriptional regulator [Chthoniobacteraceae bacterium]|nr:LacI family DNA-binding transcriptional regulator [Chthoniobacteraceae bacterium]
MPPKKPTIREVAAQAGVSPMTVSYALRGHPRISTETTRRVREIAERMRYRPHPLVSALTAEIRSRHKVKAPPVIGYVTAYAKRSNWMANPIHRGYFEGSRSRCEELGFDFQLYELTQYGMSGERLSRAMAYAGVCGIVLGPVPSLNTRLDLRWEQFSCIAMGYSLARPALHRATINHLQSIQHVFEKLMALGYTRIASVTTPARSRRVNHAFAAGFDAIQRSVPRLVRIPALYRIPRRPEIFISWLQKHRAEVLIAPEEARTLLEKAGWRIPEDLHFVTLSHRQENPQYAGLDQNPFATGEAAADFLVQQIYQNRRGIPKLPSTLMVNGSWVDGPSAPGVF